MAVASNIQIGQTPAVRHLGGMRTVWVTLALYAAAFLCFFPKAITNYDEAFYVRQATAFSAGHATIDVVDPLTGGRRAALPSYYPLGASILMAPLAWAGGWRAVFLLGLITAVIAVVCTAKWIAESGGSPAYALIILGYAPTMVMSRVAMSDVPSACVVAAGLWMFWDEGKSHPWRRLFAGFLAGVSLCLREVNPMLFAFFFAGALLRRERGVWALIVGGLTGVGCRLLGSYLVFGDPMFVMPHPGFTGEYILQNLLIYAVALLMMAPGGLIFALGYRGRRWPELICTVVFFTVLFVVYDYSASASGGLKKWVLAPRMFIPLLPILAFAMAHTAPRWFEAFTRSMSRQRELRWRRFGHAIVVSWLTGVALMSFLVGWGSIAWYKLHEQVISALYSHTDPNHPVLTDIPASVKFLNELHGQRMVADIVGISQSDVRTLMYRHGEVDIVFIERDDSDYWAQASRQNHTAVSAISKQFPVRLALEERFPGLGVLRIWKVMQRQ